MLKKTSNETMRVLFIILAFSSVIFLIPWTIWIFNALPDRNITRNWDLAWTLFDVALSISLLFTALSALKRSSWILTTAPISATLLLIDAWFDISTAATNSDYIGAVKAAFIAEIPLAIACILVTVIARRNLFKS